MSKFHWSAIEMFSESLSNTVHETPQSMTGYLRQYREYGTIERDGYYLVVERDGEYVSIADDSTNVDAIDWTGFDA